MRGSHIRAEIIGQAFAVCPMKMQAAMDAMNDDIPRMESKVANANSTAYSEVGNVAVIALDGAMYKKDMSAQCMSVVGYNTLISMIDKAEANSQIDTILFRVDTPGGSVAGAEEVRFRIKNSKKKTVTIYENLGASGGMWIFTASDELYASPQTWLGSIGVVVAYEEEDKDTKSKRMELVSKNAPNKRCGLNGDCKEKMQNMIDSIEADFFAVLKENTGFEQSKLMQIFENGGIIKAEIAKENGFIKDISHFSVLLGNLKSTAGVTRMQISNDPSGEVEVVATEDAVNVSTDVENIALSQDDLDALVVQNTNAQETIKALNVNIESMQAELTSANAILAGMESRLSMAMSYGISNDTTLSAMILAATEEEATSIAIEAKDESVSIGISDGGIASESQATADKEAKELAIALAFAKNL